MASPTFTDPRRPTHPTNSTTIGIVGDGENYFHDFNDYLMFAPILNAHTHIAHALQFRGAWRVEFIYPTCVHIEVLRIR